MFLLLGHVHGEALLPGGVEKGEPEGGGDGLGLLVPAVEVERDIALPVWLVTVRVEQDTPAANSVTHTILPGHAEAEKYISSKIKRILKVRYYY